MDTQECMHGCNCEENELHLFFQCDVAREFWFASPWGLRWEVLDGEELGFFLNCLSNPVGSLLVHPEDRDAFFLYSAIMLEHIW